MVNGGHPDHGMGGVASQGSAGSGMESAYGGAAVGVPGGLSAGQNEMSAFLDFMSNRYGAQSVTNFVDNYLNRHFDQAKLGQPLGIDAQGYRSYQNFDAKTTPLGFNAPIQGPDMNLDIGGPTGLPGVDYSGATPALEMSGRMTPAQLAALDATQSNTQNFTSFDQGFIDQMMEMNNNYANNQGPQYGGGGNQPQMIPPYWIYGNRTNGSFNDQ